MQEKEILLLTIDSLRFDYLDKEHFSQCWELFENDFVRFENAFSNGIATPHSFPSILTGYPVQGDGSLPENKPTVAELYNGYTWAISNNPHLRPERGYDRGFDYFTTFREKNEKSTSKKIIKDINSFLGRPEILRKLYNRYQYIKDPDLSPSNHLAEHIIDELKKGIQEYEGFFWAHFIDPHRPFLPQKVLDKDIEIGLSNRKIDKINDRFNEGTISQEEVDILKRFYSEIIKYLDRQLFDFFEYLRDREIYRDTMIIIMSDHGELFGERGMFSHEFDNELIEPIIRVPLLVKYPGNKFGGSLKEHLVQNADLLPTIAKKLNWDVGIPENIYPLMEEEERFVVSKSNSAVRVTGEEGFVVRRLNGSLSEEGEVGKEMRRISREETIPKIEKLSGETPEASVKQEERIKNRLEELGYINS